MTRSVVVRPDDGAPYAIAKDILRSLGLDPDSVQTKAMVLAAGRYGLDPLLGEIGVYRERVYISRDGMIRIAHQSGQLDGIVVDEQRRNSTGDGWTAYVSVWRKDMAHPFRYGAQCKDSEPQAKQGHGPEMALARAERRALRRAFAIPAYDDLDDPIIDTDAQILASMPVGETPAPTEPDGIAAGRGGTSSADHLLQQPRGAHDADFVCSCGEIFPTVWAFRVHRTARLEGPPAEIYDSAPESRGDIDDLQPASYEDPGRPFTEES